MLSNKIAAETKSFKANKIAFFFVSTVQHFKNTSIPTMDKRRNKRSVMCKADEKYDHRCFPLL